MESEFKLDTFKFTVHLKDDTSEETPQKRKADFEKKLEEFLIQQPLEVSYSDNRNYTKYKYLPIDNEDINPEFFDFALEEASTDVLSIKISNTYDYSINFYNLAHSQYFTPLQKNDEDAQIMAEEYQLLYSHPSLSKFRLKFLKEFLQFIKEEKLQSQSHIQRIGYSLQLDVKNKYRDIRLIKFHTKNKDGSFFKTHKASTRPYTLIPKPPYYKANIFSITDFLANCIFHLESYSYLQDKKKAYEVSDSNTIVALGLIEKLEDKRNLSDLSKLVQIISNNKEVSVKMDNMKRYYIYSKEFVQDIYTGNFYYPFYPKFDGDTNIFSLSNYTYNKAYKDRYGRTLNYKNIQIQKKDKTIYKFEINSWFTQNAKLLKKYGGTKYRFTLASDYEDIYNNIYDFTKKYILLELNDSMIKKSLDTYSIESVTTQKKLHKFIKSNNIKVYPLPLLNDLIEYLH